MCWGKLPGGKFTGCPTCWGIQAERARACYWRKRNAAGVLTPKQTKALLVVATKPGARWRAAAVGLVLWPAGTTLWQRIVYTKQAGKVLHQLARLGLVAARQRKGPHSKPVTSYRLTEAGKALAGVADAAAGSVRTIRTLHGSGRPGGMPN